MWGWGPRLAPPPPEVAQADPLVGSVIADRYRMVSVLGRGGMGVVYKAEHVRIGKVMAIKLLHGPSAVKMLVMQLEVDMGSMRKLANNARRAGIFVALKLSPLDSINAPQVKDFLRDGSVHMAYLTTTEA